jgi:hypothetical protein
MNKKIAFLTAMLFACIVVTTVITTVVIAATQSATTTAGNETTSGVDAAPLINAATCDFSGWVGQNLEAIDRSVLGNRPLRVLRPNDAATMDYSADRVNILTDDQNIITQVTCG